MPKLQTLIVLEKLQRHTRLRLKLLEQLKTEMHLRNTAETYEDLETYFQDPGGIDRCDVVQFKSELKVKLRF